MRRALLLIPLMLACNGGEEDTDKGSATDDTAATAGGDDGGDDGGDGGGDGGDGDDPVPCAVSVADAAPADGASDHDYRAAISFTLSAADGAAALSLVDAEGADVPGTAAGSEGDTVWTFTPSSELLPESGYTATLAFCADTDEPASASTAFTTLPEIDPFECDLTGKTFWVDLQSATWNEPNGVAPLLLGGLDNDILLGVERHEGAEVDIVGAADDGARAQDYCQATWAFPTGDFSLAPSFSVGPEDTDVSFNGFPMTMEQLRIEGEFSRDCSTLDDAELTAQIDVRTIKELVNELLGVEDPDTICTLMAGFGTTCAACPSDGEPYCIPVEVEGATATETGAPMVCVAEAYCHALCTTNDEGCDITDFPECD
jgi:hypothetical protein